MPLHLLYRAIRRAVRRRQTGQVVPPHGATGRRRRHAALLSAGVLGAISFHCFVCDPAFIERYWLFCRHQAGVPAPHQPAPHDGAPAAVQSTPGGQGAGAIGGGWPAAPSPAWGRVSAYIANVRLATNLGGQLAMASPLGAAVPALGRLTAAAAVVAAVLALAAAWPLALRLAGPEAAAAALRHGGGAVPLGVLLALVAAGGLAAAVLQATGFAVGARYFLGAAEAPPLGGTGLPEYGGAARGDGDETRGLNGDVGATGESEAAAGCRDSEPDEVPANPGDSAGSGSQFVLLGMGLGGAAASAAKVLTKSAFGGMDPASGADSGAVLFFALGVAWGAATVAQLEVMRRGIAAEEAAAQEAAAEEAAAPLLPDDAAGGGVRVALSGWAGDAAAVLARHWRLLVANASVFLCSFAVYPGLFARITGGGGWAGVVLVLAFEVSIVAGRAAGRHVPLRWAAAAEALRRVDAGRPWQLELLAAARLLWLAPIVLCAPPRLLPTGPGAASAVPVALAAGFGFHGGVLSAFIMGAAAGDRALPPARRALGANVVSISILAAANIGSAIDTALLHSVFA